MGTVAYMSPEQVAGTAAVDGRADLYSLGCVLYELMTGAPPFTAATSMGVLAKHLTELPRPPAEHNADVSPAMNDTILRLLAKEPSRRPANAGDVARILRASHRAAGASPTTSDADRLVAEGLKAYQLATSRGGSSGPLLEQAAVYFRRALTLEPNHARALCAMGNWHYVMGNAGLLPRDEAFGKGRELILAALAADDQIAQVHCSMGKLALYYDDDCQAAARHVERAVALDAHDSEVLRFQSIVYKILGRAEDAVRAASAATVQSPDVPALWNSLGDVLLSTGRNAEAVDALKHAIGLQAAYSPALERLELAHVRLGELDLALEIRSSASALAVRAAGPISCWRTRKAAVPPRPCGETLDANWKDGSSRRREMIRSRRPSPPGPSPIGSSPAMPNSANGTMRWIGSNAPTSAAPDVSDAC